jgi:hypothetical protein
VQRKGVERETERGRQQGPHRVRTGPHILIHTDSQGKTKKSASTVHNRQRRHIECTCTPQMSFTSLPLRFFLSRPLRRGGVLLLRLDLREDDVESE